MYSERCDLCHNPFNLQNKLPYALSCGDIICKDCCKASLSTRDRGMIPKCKICKSIINQLFSTMHPLKSIIKQLQESNRQIWYCNYHDYEEITFYCYQEKTFGCRKCQSNHQQTHPQELRMMNSNSITNYIQFLDNHFAAKVQKYLLMHQKIRKIKEKNRLRIQAIMLIEQDLINFFSDESIENLDKIFENIRGKKSNNKVLQPFSDNYDFEGAYQNFISKTNKSQQMSILYKQYISLIDQDQLDYAMNQDNVIQKMQNVMPEQDSFDIMAKDDYEKSMIVYKNHLNQSQIYNKNLQNGRQQGLDLQKSRNIINQSLMRNDYQSVQIDKKNYHYIPQLDKKHPYYNGQMDPNSSQYDRNFAVQMKIQMNSKVDPFSFNYEPQFDQKNKNYNEKAALNYKPQLDQNSPLYDSKYDKTSAQFDQNAYMNMMNSYNARLDPNHFMYVPALDQCSPCYNPILDKNSNQFNQQTLNKYLSNHHFSKDPNHMSYIEEVHSESQFYNQQFDRDTDKYDANLTKNLYQKQVLYYQVKQKNSPNYMASIDYDSSQFNPNIAHIYHNQIYCSILNPKSKTYNSKLDRYSQSYNDEYAQQNAVLYQFNPIQDVNNHLYLPQIDQNSTQYDPNYAQNYQQQYGNIVFDTNNINYNPKMDKNNNQYDPSAVINYIPSLDSANSLYYPKYDPKSSQYNAKLANQYLNNYNPQLDPGHPHYNPKLDPKSPQFDGLLALRYKPQLELANPAYQSNYNPKSSQFIPQLYKKFQNDYDPLLDPKHPLYDFRIDINHPLYDQKKAQLKQQNVQAHLEKATIKQDEDDLNVSEENNQKANINETLKNKISMTFPFNQGLKSLNDQQQKELKKKNPQLYKELSQLDQSLQHPHLMACNASQQKDFYEVLYPVQQQAFVRDINQQLPLYQKLNSQQKIAFLNQITPLQLLNLLKQLDSQQQYNYLKTVEVNKQLSIALQLNHQQQQEFLQLNNPFQKELQELLMSQSMISGINQSRVQVDLINLPIKESFKTSQDIKQSINIQDKQSVNIQDQSRVEIDLLDQMTKKPIKVQDMTPQKQVNVKYIPEPKKEQITLTDDQLNKKAQVKKIPAKQQDIKQSQVYELNNLAQVYSDEVNHNRVDMDKVKRKVDPTAVEDVDDDNINKINVNKSIQKINNKKEDSLLDISRHDSFNHNEIQSFKSSSIPSINSERGSRYEKNFNPREIKQYPINLLSPANVDQIKHWMNRKELNLNMIYRGSRDGFEFKDFHSKCGVKGTIIVILSEHNQLFGGYADQAWNNKGSYIQGEGKSFLFSLSKNTKHRCMNRFKELIGSSKSLAVFGEGYDLVVGPNSDWYPNSYSNLGKYYELPFGYTYQSEASKCYLAGSYEFKVQQIEVYKIL